MLRVAIFFTGMKSEHFEKDLLAALSCFRASEFQPALAMAQEMTVLIFTLNCFQHPFSRSSPLILALGKKFIVAAEQPFVLI